MVVSENDHPLTPDQERAEMDKLQQVANDPNRLRKEYTHEREEVEHTLRIVKALPDAFCYEYAGTEKGDATFGKAGDESVRLKFKPNPSYVPPSRVEQVLEGMEGYLVIDTNAKRIARIDGTLFKEVTFGWGIFGRLDQGGHFIVQQADAGDGNWAVTEMNLKFTGKILLIKNLDLRLRRSLQRLPPPARRRSFRPRGGTAPERTGETGAEQSRGPANRGEHQRTVTVRPAASAFSPSAAESDLLSPDIPCPARRSP